MRIMKLALLGDINQESKCGGQASQLTRHPWIHLCFYPSLSGLGRCSFSAGHTHGPGQTLPTETGRFHSLPPNVLFSLQTETICRMLWSSKRQLPWLLLPLPN